MDILIQIILSIVIPYFSGDRINRGVLISVTNWNLDCFFLLVLSGNILFQWT